MRGQPLEQRLTVRAGSRAQCGTWSDSECLGLAPVPLDAEPLGLTMRVMAIYVRWARVPPDADRFRLRPGWLRAPGPGDEEHHQRHRGDGEDDIREGNGQLHGERS